MVKLFARIALLTISLQATAAFARPPKSGWTHYTAPGSTSCLRNSIGKGLETHGDFNGDKKDDIAFLEVNAKLKQTQLVVVFGGMKKDENLVLQTWDGANLDLSIETLSASGKKLWCGKAAKCANDDAHAIQVKTDSIRFIHCNGAENLFTWDETAKKFTLIEVVEPTPTPKH
jgi:hypothetical protein